jgi:hypothetical protein
MSRQEDNIQNKKLKDLLNKKEKDASSMDDFEREALDGFGMLENEQEALDLKETLDKKIYTKVFSPKKPTITYWFAAAGLLLVIGLSVMFVLNNATQPQNLAIHNTGAKNNDLDTPKDSLWRKAVEQSIAHKEVLKQAPNLASNGPTSEPAISGKKMEKNKEGYHTSADIQQDEVSAAQSAPPAAAQEIPVAGAFTENTLPTGAASGAGDKTAKDVVASEPLALNEKTEPQRAAYKKQDDGNFEPKAMAQIAAGEAKKKSSGRMKNTDSEKSAQPATQAAPAEKTYGADGDFTVASLDTTPLIITKANTTFYTRLKERLQQEKISGKFDAALIVNKNGKVVKAFVDNGYNMDSKKINAVVKILESIECDDLPKSPDTYGNTRYKVTYRE